jgi:hypothetical protein
MARIFPVGTEENVKIKPENGRDSKQCIPTTISEYSEINGTGNLHKGKLNV